MVTGGLIGVMGGFMYAYQNSAGRLMGFFPNEAEIARFKKAWWEFVVLKSYYQFSLEFFTFAFCWIMFSDAILDCQLDYAVIGPCVFLLLCYFPPPLKLLGDILRIRPENFCCQKVLLRGISYLNVWHFFVQTFHILLVKSLSRKCFLVLSSRIFFLQRNRIIVSLQMKVSVYKD